MRDLTKPFKVRGTRPFMHTGRRIVLELHPGDVLVLRLEGERTRYRATLSALYELAVRLNTPRPPTKADYRPTRGALHG